MKRVAIVGGGISGLATAYYLSRSGIGCTLFEQRAELGGLIRTEEVDGCLVEAGPDSWLAEKAWMLDLIRELGLGDQVVGSRDEQRRVFVVRDGRPRAVPESMGLLAPKKPWQLATTRLLSLGGKARFATEWLRRPRSFEERSVADFVLDHFGSEVLEYLAQPMLAGIYGSPPDKLSADEVIPRLVEYERRYGSVMRGAFRNRHRRPQGSLFQTLRDGLQTLVTAMERAIRPTCEVVHEGVAHVATSESGWRVRCEGTSLDFDDLVLATPAHEAGRLLAETASGLAALLGRIRYTSSVVAALVYPAADFGHALDGFGLLVPRCEGGSLAACTWVNTKFAGRAPADKILLRAFLAGESADRALRSDSDEVLREADAELRRWMGFRPPLTTGIVRRWERSLPQYAVGHKDVVIQLEDAARRFRGLHLAGNGYSGLGIPDCIRRSRGIAEAIAKHAVN